MEYVKHHIFAAALMDGKEVIVKQVNQNIVIIE